MRKVQGEHAILDCLICNLQKQPLLRINSICLRLGYPKELQDHVSSRIVVFPVRASKYFCIKRGNILVYEMGALEVELFSSLSVS